MGSEGSFTNVRADWTGGNEYTHWIPAAAMGVYHVHNEDQYLWEVLSLLARNVDYTFAAFDPDRDALPAAHNHFSTGMEWQPSFFFFNDYDNSKPEARLERPDFAAYLYASCLAVAEGYRLLDDRLAEERYRALAAKVESAVLETLWHEKDQFFYAVRERDNVPARCCEVVGFYPFSFGLAPLRPPYLDAFDRLVDPGEFWTSFPPATVARSVPVFSAAIQTWPGPGGQTTGCMWNGPTWPHAQSLAAEAMARALRAKNARDRRANEADAFNRRVFADFLGRYGRLHFEEGDLGRPMIREYYDGDTGVGWGCPDYFHSTYNDLLIRFVGGLMPSSADELSFFPLLRHLDYFRFSGLRYHGKELEIVWVRPGSENPYPDRSAGYTILVDGKKVAHDQYLRAMTVDL
jgi:hypothetical protein